MMKAKIGCDEAGDQGVYSSKQKDENDEDQTNENDEVDCNQKESEGFYT